MAVMEDLIGLLVILLIAFAIYMKQTGKTVRDLIIEIKEGFKR